MKIITLNEEPCHQQKSWGSLSIELVTHLQV